MGSKKKLIDVIYRFIEGYISSDESKSPEMVAAIAELLKAVDYFSE